jgi:arsenate reductase
MKKIYYLSNCSTSKAIIKGAGIDAPQKKFILQDIKPEKITPRQLDEMKRLAGSYEKLFSRRALKYKELGLKNKKLTEENYRNYILTEYTFLKRPVIIIDDKIFIGSEKKTIKMLKETLRNIF